MKINKISAPFMVSDRNTFQKQKYSTSPNFKGIFSAKDIFSRNKISDENKYKTLIENIKHDSINYIFKTPKIEIKDLNKILKKYIPDAQVEELQEREEWLGSHGVAYYENYIQHKKNNNRVEERVTDKKLYVKLPDNQNLSNRTDILASFIHEAVHLIQAEKEIKTQGGVFIKKYYDENINRKPISEIDKAVEMLNYAYSNFENCYSDMMSRFINICPHPSLMTFEYFNQYLITNTGYDVNNVPLILLDKAFASNGSFIVETLGKNSINEYIKYKTSQEAEAYTQSNIIYQSYCPQSIMAIGSNIVTNAYLCLQTTLNPEKNN